MDYPTRPAQHSFDELFNFTHRYSLGGIDRRLLLWRLETRRDQN
jgi:hypothetical protein